MYRKLAIIILCLLLINFVAYNKLIQAAGPATPAIGAGGYVVGALAIGGVAGALGYSEHADVINKHAHDVWDKTLDMTKDAWEATKNWVGGLPFIAINNPEMPATYPLLDFPLSTVHDLSVESVARSVPEISQRVYQSNASFDNSIGYPTQYPGAIFEHTKASGHGYSEYTRVLSVTLPDDFYFYVYVDNFETPIGFKRINLSANSTSNTNPHKEHIPTLSNFHPQSSRESYALDYTYTNQRVWGGLFNGVQTVEHLLGLINGNGAINDIYVGDSSLYDEINAVRSVGLQVLYDSLPSISIESNVGRLSIPLPEGKLGTSVGDIPAGADIVYNPADDLWYTPDGTLVGNPSDIILNPPAIPRTIEHPLTGVPTLVFDTPWGMVNVGTGEIITTGDGVGEGEIPNPNSPPIDLSRPKRALDLMPLIMTSESFKSKFPFSIPWDLQKQFSIFNVTAETPIFEHNDENFINIGDKSIPFRFSLSLEKFEVLAASSRWFLLIAFDVSIILLMRRLMPE